MNNEIIRAGGEGNGAGAMDMSGLDSIPLASLPQAIRAAVMAYQSIRTYEDVERFLLSGNGFSKHTRRSYLESFKAFTQYAGAENVFDVLPADIENWFDHLMETVAPRTSALRIAGVRAIYKALETLIPNSSPFRKIPDRLEKRLKAPAEKNLTALDAGEFNRLLSFAEDPLEKAIVFFLGTSGLRSAEALSLRWQDVEEVNGELVAYGIGKGAKPFQVAIFPDALQAVRTAFKDQTGRSPQKDDWLFMLDGRELLYNSLYRRMVNLGKRAQAAGVIGSRHDLTPHTFRRTCASILHTAGMSSKGVQGITRHSNLETLEKHYLKVNESPTPLWSTLMKDTLMKDNSSRYGDDDEAVA